MLTARELGFHYLGWLHVDALLQLQRGIDGEHALDEVRIAAHLVALVHKDEIRSVKSRLHGARQAAAACTHDKQIGVVGLVHLAWRLADGHRAPVRARTGSAGAAGAGVLRRRAGVQAAHHRRSSGNARARQERATGYARTTFILALPEHRSPSIRVYGLSSSTDARRMRL